MKEVTPAELDRLYNEEDLSQREIADQFDLSQSCISKKMKKWGIKSEYGGLWTEEELEIIKNCYPEEKDKLKSNLDRSWNAVKLKAMDLGLARDQEEYRNSDEVKSQLRRLATENEIRADFDNRKKISYVVGVIDGDGYHDNKSAIGLEVKNPDFADKFSEALEEIGLNPNQGERRGKKTVWASSKSFIEWLMELDYESKLKWLVESGDRWSYLEGAYDSDGDFSLSSPRICSYDEEEKAFVKRLLESLGLEANLQQNNVYVPVSSRDKFFENVDPVYEKRRP